MYEPTTSISEFGDSVIVLMDNARGYAFGRYTGYNRGESYQIKVEDLLTGNKSDQWIHKEDIYQNTEENLERVREIV